ncbi:MAG: 2,3-diphosphoglycerate-dependent phosphoglycerate mutase [Pseudobdellovibrionaceae bacterium]
MSLVLLRHGESIWNQENRFTGWVDVDLTAKGISEAKSAGQVMKKEGLVFDQIYTSYLKRAIRTLHFALEEMDLLWLPVIKDWRLNERHYGGLQGLNKTEMAQLHGEEKVKLWRRSFDVPPPAIAPDHPQHPSQDPKYKLFDPRSLPSGESLKLTIERFMPLWEQKIAPDLKSGKSVLVVAHGNSLRAMVKHIEGLSEAQIMEVNMPTGVPLKYELDSNLKMTKKDFLGNAQEIAQAIAKVANQGKAK